MGELAWQLGGREAYDYIIESDRKQVALEPDLEYLFEKYGGDSY